jgi:Spy/CpxP family protein refolding chaperone
MGLLPAAIGRLDLTSAQRDQVRTIVDGHRDELRGLLERQRDARTALEAAVNAPELNEAAVRARAADLAKVEADMAVARAHVFADVFHVLTPDQQNQLEKMETARADRQGPGRAPRRGPRGRGPQGPPPPDGPPL